MLDLAGKVLMSEEFSHDGEGDRKTSDLILMLDEDYRSCYAQILKRLDEGERDEHGHIHADHGFDARQLIRSAFAYIEGATFVLKIEAPFSAEEKDIELTPQELHFIF